MLLLDRVRRGLASIDGSQLRAALRVEEEEVVVVLQVTPPEARVLA